MRSRPLAALLVATVLAVACSRSDPAFGVVTFDVVPELDEIAAVPFHHHGIDGWLVRLPDGEVRAHSAQSPHLGCFLYAVTDPRQVEQLSRQFGFDATFLFHDVCTGSWFLPTGERTFGPAPRFMDRFLVLSVTRLPNRHYSVEVDLSQVLLGRCGTDGFEECSPPDEERWLPTQRLLDFSTARRERDAH